MLSVDTTTCRHGESGDCVDCCMGSLDRLLRQLRDEDAVHVVPPEMFNRLRSVVVALRARLMYFQDNDGFIADDTSEFYSPRAEPSAKRFQPVIVPVPAFTSRPSVSATAPTQATQSEQPAAVQLPSFTSRRTWNPDQVDALKRAYARLGNQWEQMRKDYPELRSFTGMQIKDKYRATFGERRTSNH